MRIHYLIAITASFLLACNHFPSEDQPDKTTDRKIRKQVTSIAEDYIMCQLTEPQRIESKNGLITVSDAQTKYIIEPSRIFTGLIDDNTSKDAIVSLSVFKGQFQSVSEQLIILKTGKDFVLASALESDMKIISLKDRTITADVPEHTRNSPLFNCESCWEVVKYQLKMGELVRVE